MSDLSWTNVTVKLSDLLPWTGNPKTSTGKNAQQLVTSRDELGQFQTVAIEPTDKPGVYQVADGHQRLSAWLAKYGKAAEIDARLASRPLTETERRKIAIYSRQIGAWDWDVLSGWEPDELTGWGFDVDLLNDWRRDVAALGSFLESEEEQAQGDAEAARRTLAERFVVPPFSVLDARQGYWQDRKRAWLALGIQSELGRGKEIAPGGSLLEEATPFNGHTVRGDGKGRTLGAIAPNEAGNNGILSRTGKYAVSNGGGVKMALHNDPMQRKDKYDGKG